jgi:hypothetical protein
METLCLELDLLRTSGAFSLICEAKALVFINFYMDMIHFMPLALPFVLSLLKARVIKGSVETMFRLWPHGRGKCGTNMPSPWAAEGQYLIKLFLASGGYQGLVQKIRPFF